MRAGKIVDAGTESGSALEKPPCQSLFHKPALYQGMTVVPKKAEKTRGFNPCQDYARMWRPFMKHTLGWSGFRG